MRTHFYFALGPEEERESSGDQQDVVEMRVKEVRIRVRLNGESVDRVSDTSDQTQGVEGVSKPSHKSARMTNPPPSAMTSFNIVSMKKTSRELNRATTHKSLTRSGPLLFASRCTTDGAFVLPLCKSLSIAFAPNAVIVTRVRRPDSYLFPSLLSSWDAAVRSRGPRPSSRLRFYRAILP